MISNSLGKKMIYFFFMTFISLQWRSRSGEKSVTNEIINGNKSWFSSICFFFSDVCHFWQRNFFVTPPWHWLTKSFQSLSGILNSSANAETNKVLFQVAGIFSGHWRGDERQNHGGVKRTTQRTTKHIKHGHTNTAKTAQKVNVWITTTWK